MRPRRQALGGEGMSRLNNLGLVFIGLNAIAICSFGSFAFWNVVLTMPKEAPLPAQLFGWYLGIAITVMTGVSIYGTIRNIIDTIKEWNRP